MKTLSLLLFSLLLLFSCEYDPKGEYNNPSKKNETPPEIQIDLQFNQDTIIFKWPSDLQFLLEAKNTDIRWSDVYINDSLVYSNLGVSNGIISFNLGYHIKAIGTYKMRIEFFTSSGTGSIADQLEAEGFLFSKDWTLVASAFDTPEIHEVFIKNGQVIVNWYGYPGEKFYYYQVQKMVNNKIYDLSQTYKADETSIIDSSYLGETTKYRVITKTYSNVTYYSQWYKFEHTESWKEPTLKIINTVPFITWNLPSFYKNIKYNLILEYHNNILDTLFSDSTSFTWKINFTPPIDDQFELKLKIEPKLKFNYFDLSELQNNYTKSYNFSISERFNAFLYYSVPNKNYFYFVQENIIKKYTIDLSSIVYFLIIFSCTK